MKEQKEQIEETRIEGGTGFLARAQAFIQKNQKMLIACGAVIVVVVGFLCLRAFVFTPHAQESAAKEVFYAENYYSTGIMNNDTASLKKALDGDGKHPGFKKIIDQHSGGLTHGTPAIVNTCKFYAGIASLRLGKFDDAIKYLEDYSPKDYYTQSLTLMSLGDAYVEKGDNKKAIDLYVKASETNPNDITSPAALFKAGMCSLAANDKDAALKHFNTIKEKYPMSAEYSTIDYYIGIAEAK